MYKKLNNYDLNEIWLIENNHIRRKIMCYKKMCLAYAILNNYQVPFSTKPVQFFFFLIKKSDCPATLKSPNICQFLARIFS